MSRSNGNRYVNLTTEALLKALARATDGRRRNQILRALTLRGAL